ncbi:hypothetical protein [uncultured Roseibium sp.]|uniref:hypothetical protein n=1 Tax=uncultured Roseibium sp. TaxID=1936171 RepID=UPI0032173A30
MSWNAARKAIEKTTKITALAVKRLNLSTAGKPSNVTDKAKGVSMMSRTLGRASCSVFNALGKILSIQAVFCFGRMSRRKELDPKPLKVRLDQGLKHSKMRQNRAFKHCHFFQYFFDIAG